MPRRRLLIADHLAVESARRSLYRELAKFEQFEVHLLVPARWSEHGIVVECEKESDSSVVLHRSPILFGYRTHRFIYTKLHSILSRLKPDLFWIEMEPENYGAAQAMLLRRLFSPRTKLGLVSWRNIDHRKVGFPYKLAFTHRLCDSLVAYRPTDVVFSRSVDCEELLGRYGQHVVSLPAAIDCTLFKREERREDGEHSGPILIGYVGRLIDSKGIELLIDALRKLPESVHLLIVGNGPLEEKLKAMSTANGLTSRVTIRPAARYAEIPSLLNRLDILVLPSLETRFWKEQFGRAVVEAMACEVPVVVSDSGALPTVVDDAGLIFRAGDGSDLVEKIRLLLESAEIRRSLGKRGRAHVLKNFEVGVVARRHAEVISELLSGDY